MSAREEADVVVVGAGAAGLAAALSAGSHGADTLVIERDGAAVGGTMRKSVGAVWVPGNRFMRAAGLDDDRTTALRYMARLSRPAAYDPDHATLGLTAWEHEQLGAFHDRAAQVAEALEDAGAVTFEGRLDEPDNFAHLPENAAPRGRKMLPLAPGGLLTGGAEVADGLHRAALATGVRFRLGCSAIDVVRDADGITGLTVSDGNGDQTVISAPAVIFTTGGFAQSAELRREYLDAPLGPGCSVLTNTGDFVYIARRLGAHLTNMTHAWKAPIAIERVLREPETVKASFFVPGDGMLAVNRRGLRAVNEKASYNELTRAFFEFDPGAAEYPNLPLVLIADRRQVERFGDLGVGTPFPKAPGPEHYWLLEVDRLEDLGPALDERLVALGGQMGGARVAPEFTPNLLATVARFGQFARTGRDEDFRRGETPIEQTLAERTGGGDGPNITMRPLDPGGPYYAVILGPAAFDTKGGPRTDVDGRVLHVDGRPIPGLFAAGNCAASPSVEAYWAGGASLGMCFSFGWHAGRAATALSKTRSSTATG